MSRRPEALGYVETVAADLVSAETFGRGTPPGEAGWSLGRYAFSIGGWALVVL